MVGMGSVLKTLPGVLKTLGLLLLTLQYQVHTTIIIIQVGHQQLIIVFRYREAQSLGGSQWWRWVRCSRLR